MVEYEIENLDDPEVLHALLEKHEADVRDAIGQLGRSLIGGAEVREEDIVDLILAADNLQAVAEHVAEYGDVDLVE